MDRSASYRQSPLQDVSHRPRTPQCREATVACEYLGTSIVGEERRVDVDDPPGKCFQKRGGENQHPASEDDEIRGEGTKHFG